MFPIFFIQAAIGVIPWCMHIEGETGYACPNIGVYGLQEVHKIVWQNAGRPVTKYRTFKASLTAYTSAISETDSTPFITADGTDLHTHSTNEDYKEVCARNDLPFGTLLYNPLVGICTVHDRMAKKYSNRVDLYMGWGTEMKKEATLFGIKRNQTFYIIP